ncbi:MAG: GNAT family N-acetyltransferase [Actinobacteria bacterium]|nr:GNAT family N-acetyltransferase [Actinomycetota bacterium]
MCLVDIPIKTVDEPGQAELQRLITNLGTWNNTVAPPEEHRKLAVFAYAADELIGGAAGYTHWGWLFVSHLWVQDGSRRARLGSRLMEQIEAAAVGRGAEMAHLDTYDFQARQFYEHIGYEQFAELENYPRGHSRHFLRKPLV